MLFSIFFFFFFFSLIVLFLEKNMIISFNMLSNLMITFDLELNLFNSTFSLVVMMISMMIFFYVKTYFSFKVKLSFKINLLVFIFSMMILIFSNNMLSLVVGWDGLGISSFFLVSFYSNQDSSISSLITFFFNRLGDSFMILFLSMSLFFSFKNNLIFSNIFLFFILIMCLFTKSSQIPFGVWLPMAMSAPTPISSLVHSSTLVTAGILVIMKFNNIFFIKEVFLVLIYFSLLTFFLGGLFSLMIMDLKKSVAFSTLSQLGFILFSLSLGNFMISFYHLIFHAFFKSLLFMNLGFFMMINYSNQDFRLMNSFSMNYFPKLTMMISILNLMGFFLTCGFLSKDIILINLFNNVYKFIILIFFYLSCMNTIFYSLKILLIFSINFKMKYFNIILLKKMSIYFLGIFLICLLLLLIPIMFFDLLMIQMEIFLNYKNKIMFYFIVFISLVFFKYFFFLNSKLNFLFSSMLMILEFLNFFLMKTNILNNKISYLFLMMEEMFYMNMFLKLTNSPNVNMYMNIMINSNVMLMFLYFLMMKF